jgi:hypothetical protein
MCQHEATIPPASSRRRRLWELPSHAFCPVVGVCLPIQALRRLATKVLGGQPVADDYELHCGVITECRQRTPMAEAVQRELDRRNALQLRAAWTNKTTEALASWWQAKVAGSDVAGALWATLSHPRCDAQLQDRVLSDIHMLQHQVGSANRVSIQRLNELADENAVLTRELATVQRRSTHTAADQHRKIQQLESEMVQLRVRLIRRDTELAAQAEELQALEAAVPGLKERASLARSLERQAARIHELERELLRRQQANERAEARAEAAERSLRDLRDQREAATQAAAAEAPRLDDRAVLCVGGRPANVPVYRELVERVGGRFLHHDGGEEDKVGQLDATLESADLVICQTGCISHDAYWRVKEHCKRTGKRCVFVEKPSRAGLQRALSALVTSAPGARVIPIAPAA